MQAMRLNASHNRRKPPAVTVPIAGRLLGFSRMTAHRRVMDGSLPTMRLQGRRLVPIAVIEQIIGREISADEIAEASARKAGGK